MSKTIYQYEPKPAAWLKRDILLFANSIGCTAAEMHYLYELHPDFAAFPAYPLMLTFKHDSSDVVDFKDHFGRFLTPPPAIPALPDLPALDSDRVVDGERAIEIIRPLPVSSQGRTFEIRSSVIGVWDKAIKATVIETEHLIVETGVEDTLFTRMTEIAFYMGQGGWGGPNGPSTAIPKPAPEERPFATLTHDIGPTAHLLYRLNGDFNPLHATECPNAIVQPTPIMHGLYSWNTVCHSILEKLCKSDPRALKSFRARFTSPVRPGDTLITDVWICGMVDDVSDNTHGDGWREVRFTTRVKGGKVCLTNGSAVVRLAGGTKPTSKL
ncbi:hypothetical protein AAFC00_005054 [Neodothiora populina]|uniref:MaoC-like domain-containing protein n=1 Tax=Neodothiora populina TaxID=2781224 RepID=A0ABR3PJV8_9PEZI